MNHRTIKASFEINTANLIATAVNKHIKSAVAFCRFDEAACREAVNAEIARRQVGMHKNGCECPFCAINRDALQNFIAEKENIIAGQRPAHRQRLVATVKRCGQYVLHYAITFAACFLAVILARAVVA